MNRLKILSLFLFIILVNNLQAQNSTMTLYNMDNGLANNRVNSIVQDENGFMWFATNDGLCRFDGIRFKTFRISDYISKTSSNFINKIFIDSRKQMWIGTNNGIFIFDYINNTFKPFKVNTLNNISIYTPVFDFAENNEYIWIGTNGQGIFKYDINNLELEELKYTDSNERKIITSICADSKNNIWFGTYSDGIFKYNNNTDSIKHYIHDSYITNSLSDNTIHKIFEDSYGNIWIGTSQGGIDKYDYENECFINVKDYSKSNFLYHIHDITEYNPGSLLITSDNGICLLSTQSLKIHTFYDKCIKFIYSVYLDKEHGIWLGSYFDGIQYISPFHDNFAFYECNSSTSNTRKVINCIVSDTKGKYWIGTDDDGIYMFDSVKKIVSPYRTGKNINSTYYCIHDILIDGDLMYVATYGRGLEIINTKTNKVETFPNNSYDAISSRIYKLFKSSDGIIFLGTYDGLYYMKQNSTQIIKVGNFNGVIQTIVEDKNGTIWAGSRSDGLMAYYTKNNKYKIYRNDNSKNSLPQNAISALCIDNNNKLWIGLSGQGICLYNNDSDNFKRFEDLELPNNVISSIIAFGDDLWIATNKGLTQFNHNKNIIKTYSKSSGLTNEQFTIGASYLSHNGEIFLGTRDGLCIFQPQLLRQNSHNSPLYITNIAVGGKTIENNINNRLEVSYDQSMIEFDFSVLSYTAPKENIYEYMMTGIDEKWIKSKGENNHISYNKLPPGKYTLKIKGKNSDMTDCKNEIDLDVYVKPPFFRSNIAYFLYIIIILCISFLIVKSYIRRAHRKQERNLMRITREKEKELYNSKIEFFTNIAHEIRTPLSLIIGPLDHLIQTTDINDKYGDYLNIIEHNYKRLYTLVNQLLDFRKVDSGALKFSYREYNLKKLIQKTYMVFELTIRQKKININIDAIPDDYYFITDEESFTKIMSNLISNAIKYAKNNIIIGFYDNEKSFTLSVTDDGPGIDDKEKEKIFEAFYQIKRKNDSNNPGIGIGLHITYALIQMMDGSITVDNRTDGNTGVCFTLSLPKVKAEENAITTNNTKQNNDEIIEIIKEQNDSKETATDNKKTVIVVDDNLEILDFLGKVLGVRYFVITAKSGEDCLSILEKNKPDIIVCDVMMEGINGFEVCKRIKNNINMSHIPVILLTAKTDTESKVEGLDSGADAYIEKPFAASHLIAQIENLLRKKEEFQKAFATNPLSEIHSVNQNKLDEEFIEQCTKIILENLDNSDFSINTLAQELNMSRTSIFTKIKGIMGMTPNDFIKVIKLKQAAKLLTEGKYRISEITYITGFSSSSYFAKCFQKQFGILPTDFIRNLKLDE